MGTALLTAVSVAAAVQALKLEAQLRGIQSAALESVLRVVMTTPPGLTGAWGPATLTTERLNLMRRSQFVVSAARRVTADLVSARSHGRPLSAQLVASVTRERRYYAQHLMAVWQRSNAGAAADSAAMTYGLLLGWHAKADGHTSRECLAANGRNFYADHMPLIGYPGAVHPHCRCQPGPPFPGARLVPSYGLPAARAYRRAA